MKIKTSTGRIDEMRNGNRVFCASSQVFWWVFTLAFRIRASFFLFFWCECHKFWLKQWKRTLQSCDKYFFFYLCFVHWSAVAEMQCTWLHFNTYILHRNELFGTTFKIIYIILGMQCTLKNLKFCIKTCLVLFQLKELILKEYTFLYDKIRYEF